MTKANLLSKYAFLTDLADVGGKTNNPTRNMLIKQDAKRHLDTLKEKFIFENGNVRVNPMFGKKALPVVEPVIVKPVKKVVKK